MITKTSKPQGASHAVTSRLGEKAASLLRALPATLGGVIALAAHAKPAYELMRSLASIRGIILPPLP